MSSTTEKLTYYLEHPHGFWYYLLAIVVTLVMLAFTAVYMEAGEQGMMEYIAKKYFRAKAKAEEKALEKAGSDEARGFLKDQLKKNPALDNKELNQIDSGLGDEASKEFGKLGKKFG